MGALCTARRRFRPWGFASKSHKMRLREVGIFKSIGKTTFHDTGEVAELGEKGKGRKMKM